MVNAEQQDCQTALHRQECVACASMKFIDEDSGSVNSKIIDGVSFSVNCVKKNNHKIGSKDLN